MDKKNTTEVIVIVEGGMVTAVYADSKEVLVNVLDMDT